VTMHYARSAFEFFARCSTAGNSGKAGARSTNGSDFGAGVEKWLGIGCRRVRS
jgi:hypothetical protein